MPDNAIKPFVVLIFVVLLVFTRPLVWRMLAEIFPLKIRSFAMGVCVLLLWMANAVVTFGFPLLVSALGIASTFFVFARIGVLGIVLIATMVPETRGKSLEEFEEFRTRRTTR